MKKKLINRDRKNEGEGKQLKGKKWKYKNKFLCVKMEKPERERIKQLEK